MAIGERRGQTTKDELWPKCIIELATMERLFNEVLHCEGSEDITEIMTMETVDSC